MGLRWFNFVGFFMLFAALFLNEVIYLNVWHDSNFFLVLSVQCTSLLQLGFRSGEAYAPKKLDVLCCIF